MIRLLLGAAPDRIRAAPALFALQLAAISLGVGAVLSVEILNRAALDTLSASLEVISGERQLVVTGILEEPGSVPDAAWPAVLGVSGVAGASPVLRLPGRTLVRGEREATLPIWGVDLLSGSFDFAAPGAEAAVFSAAAFFAGGVVLPAPAAEALDAGTGDRVRIEAGPEVVVAGISSGAAAFLDLAAAQALRGSPGFDRLEVAVGEGRDPDAVIREIEAGVPGVRVETAGALREQGADLFAAFRLNLRALSAVSLLVGAFLVYASVRAALAARRREIGLYRSLGAPAGTVGALLLGEVFLTTVAGVLLGVPVGALAASGALDRVSATITNFYLLERIESVSVTPGAIATSALVGLAAGILGALPEVWAESRRPLARLLAPGREIGGRVSGGARWLAAGAGVCLLALAGWPLLSPGGWLSGFGGGFVVAGALLVGAALLPGAALGLLSPLAAAAPQWSAFGRGVVAAIREARSTAPPAAALVVAVTMVVGVTALVGSFRATLEGWLESTLAADIYVSRSRGPGRVAAERRRLPPPVLDITAADPEVLHRDLLRAVRVRLGGRPTSVFGVEAALPEASARFRFLAGRDGALAGFRNGEILISEPLARRLGVAPGDSLTLPTPGGGHAARVAGIYRDYGNESGALFLDRGLMDRLWPPPRTPEVHGLALYLREGAEPGAVADRLERDLAGSAFFVDNRTLRSRALEVFDQTMTVTRLFRAFALLIAALGVGLALWTLARERVAEIALERALGAEKNQVVSGFLGRAFVVTGLGLGIGGGAGCLLAVLLVEVVNPNWFGWTLELHWPVGPLALSGAAVALSGLLAAALPARLAAGTDAAALRPEI